MSIKKIPVRYLKGVGEKKAASLERKFGIKSVYDLLYYLPCDWNVVKNISELTEGHKQTAKVRVDDTSCGTAGYSMVFFQASVSDSTGKAIAVWFKYHNRNYDPLATLKKYIVPGVSMVITGSVQCKEFWLKKMNVQEFEIFPADSPQNILGPVRQFYPLQEGFKNNFFRKIIAEALKKYSGSIDEIIPEKYLREYSLLKIADAVKNIHFPESPGLKDEARKRLAFDEFLNLELKLELLRKQRKCRKKDFRYNMTKELLTPFRQHLPFEFTAAQTRVINEIFENLNDEYPMNRLLQGDVGSGKTVVALSCSLLAIESGFQVVLLAPTEILAEQHMLTFKKMLEGLPVTIELFIGKMKPKKKSELKKRIAVSVSNIVIGTHALLEEDIKFKNLSLVVIDEQQKFGVEQRLNMKKKSPFASVDLLMMTATPIPRTLALTLYGDLDVSTIDELPPGRVPVKTLRMTEQDAYNFAREKIKKGEQVFIVYPLVDESDKTDLKSAVREAEKLKKNEFREYSVGLIHGRLKPEEKDSIMSDFAAKKYDVLISTTVIEVGIDVPSATTMIIEHSDRYGLATLHQLRGRIGRGSRESHCILLGEPKTENSKRRLKVLMSTTDGFRIAEEDLFIRGQGEFFGTAQSGLPLFKAGNIITDIEILKMAKTLAEKIVRNETPLLERMIREDLKDYYNIVLAEV